ncbi:MAG: glycine cleavage system aminomethyltransferase GcvT [Oligoflexales bacterium]
MNQLKKTALTDWHTKEGAVMAPFAGWNMPLRYSSVIKEHHAVRQNAGVFDVSHMGEFIVSGDDTMRFLQSVTINDITKLSVGEGQYTAMCQQDGGMIDDLILYRVACNEVLLCVNASNIQKDFDWLQSHIKSFNVSLKDESPEWSQIALQGPASIECLQKATGMQAELKYMEIQNFTWNQENTFIARTGYTGEQGIEWYLPHSVALAAWEALVGAGASPIGLGARDTLRLEACYLLYGQDMNEATSALEAGLGWATKLEYDFVGQATLKKQKEEGVRRRIVAFQMQDRGVPRAGMEVYQGMEKVGVVTSGSVLPSLDAFGGLLMLDRSVKINEDVLVDVRGRKISAKIMKKPMYQARL